MRRLLPLLGLTLALAGVGAAPALASVSPPAGFDPTGDDIFQTLIREDPLLGKVQPLSTEMQSALDRLPDMTPEERAQWQENVYKGHTRAKTRALRLPGLSSFLLSIPISVGATLGYEAALKMSIPGQGTIYHWITGEDYEPAGTGSYDYSWIYTSSGSTFDWNWGTNPRWHPVAKVGASVHYDFYCAGGDPDVPTVVYTTFSGLPATHHQGTSSAGTCGANLHVIPLRTNAQMEAAIAIRPSDDDEYTAATNKHDAGSYSAPTITSTDYENAWAEGDTTVENDWRTFIYLTTNEEADYSETFVLPQPLPNETHSAYLARLAALGHVGTVVTIEEGDELDNYGPLSPTRVVIPGASVGTTRILDPIRWPSPSPSVQKGAQITVRYNPATATQVAEGAGTTPITPPPTTVPGTPALDFTPLTDIDFGCKFPYGFLCYAVAVTESFDVAPDAPRFVFDIPTVNVGVAEFGGGEDGWVVDLEVMDGWAEIWRDIWSVVIVIGAVYLVATRLLGFKAGGDPGAAMDDAL